jgi:hypothetical protein
VSSNAVRARLAPIPCPLELTIRRLWWSPLVLVTALVLVLAPAEVRAEEDPVSPGAVEAAEPAEEPVVVAEPALETSGVTAFTGLLETRKRQLVTSYYLYRGPAPDRTEMDSAIGAIDRLILQDYSLEDIWSTIFHIMISEPDLAHRPFEEVIPPNIQRASIWRQGTTPVKVVIEERYPEFDLVYKQALRRKRTFGYLGAAAFVPSYTLSIAFGSAEVGSMYNRARSQGVEFNAGAAFLPMVPLIGPVLTQAWMDREAGELGDLDYDAGSHLVGAVWGTLIQALGVTAIIISVSQPLPQPFGDDDDGRTASRKRREPPRFQASFGPTSVGVGFTF